MTQRKKTNELEFQGQVGVWLNEEIQRHDGLGLDKATQEKPRKSSGKRNDLVVWSDRSSEIAFLTIELKTPTTPINDPVFLADAVEKAQHWQATYFALWNMREIEVYLTPPKGTSPTPDQAIDRSSAPLAITQVEDWLVARFEKELRKQAIGILRAAVDHRATGHGQGHAIDPQIFVARMTESVSKLRNLFYRDLKKASHSSKKLRAQLNRLATEQGFSGFVEDIDYAVAGQIAYRLSGQVLFYFALRRKLPTLKPLLIGPKDGLPAALQPFWNEVRRYDYEALFGPDPIDDLIPLPSDAQKVLRQLIEQLGGYDWASLTDDVLGSIFETLIPREEQDLLGQFYTPRPVADLLVAFTLDGERPLVLDPGCGSGTFLMSAYSYLAHSSGLSHKDLLSTIWGFDISSFAAELGVINLYRQNLSEYENFPRIVPGNFFDRRVGQTVAFPPPKLGAGPKKVPIPIPHFDSIVGNPPYLRSQNQDDLDPAYRTQLFKSALAAGIDAPAKTDLFVFFIYQALLFMRPGTRLGFVTPASWLTADYAATLQRVLLDRLHLVAVIASGVESFFPQVDINAVLLVAEMPALDATRDPIRFVNLKKSIQELTLGPGEYWDRVTNLVTEIEAPQTSIETDKFRIRLISSLDELEELRQQPDAVRNWSRHLRAPLSYDLLFDGWHQ